MLCSQATVSEECCKGLNTWNDAGCYCDGVASVMDDPNTPTAYVALARELNPACAVEKTTDTNHRTCAPPPPAPPPLPPPPRPPPGTPRVVHAGVRDDDRGGDVGCEFQVLRPGHVERANRR